MECNTAATLATVASRAEHSFPGAAPLRGSRAARWILGRFGWRVDFAGFPARQGVVVVYPHTSNWDFVVMVLAKWSMGVQVSFWAKDSLFRIPLFGRWLRWIGGVPVQRHAPRGVVAQAVERFKQCKALQTYFWLGLSPEGTRKATAGWRSGFYQTAVQAQVPLCLVSLDYACRQVIANQSLRLSGDPEADFRRIADTLRGVRGKIPANAAPIRLMVPKRRGPSANL